MKSIAALTLLLMAHYTHGADTDYSDNGKSWETNTYITCRDGKEQSPIDLTTKNLKAIEEESFFKHYENVEPVPWGGDYGKVYFSSKSSAVYLTLDKDTKLDSVPTPLPEESTKWFATPNYFKSTAGKKAHDRKELFFSKQLHFHAQSEHTIDGKQFDLEMHVVHMSLDPTYAVMGMMFDTKNYDENVSEATVAAIDKFFDSLKFDEVTKTGMYPSEIAFGELMSVINMNDRWVYKGSLTTPPCSEGLYWNFVKTVYPIKQYHLNYYYQALYANGNKDTKVFDKGNWRYARPAAKEHGLTLIKSPPPPAKVEEEEEDSASDASLAMIILLCLSMIVVLTLVVYSCLLHDKLNTPSYKQPEGKPDVGIVPESEMAGAPPKEV